MIDAAEAVARLRDSTGAFLAVLDGVSEREWNICPAGEEWSLAETVEHVVITNRLVRATLERLFETPLVAGAPRFDDAAISAEMFEAAAPVPPGLAEPKGCFAMPAAGAAALAEIRDDLIAWARRGTADLRSHGLPHPVFGVFDGVQWILFAAAHTDNHLSQLRALRARVAAACPPQT